MGEKIYHYIMKNVKKYLIYLGGIVVFIVAIVLYRKIFNKVEINPNGVAQQVQPRSANRDLPVMVYIAGYDFTEHGLTSVGSLRAKESVNITSELSGKIVSIDFEEGQFVKRGEVLIRLDDRELQSQLTRAKYQLELIEARLERQKILLEKDAVSREAYDQVLTEYNVLTEDIRQIEIKIDKSQIKAPFDGLIGFRQVSLGAYMQPNMVVATLVDIKNMVIEFAISEKYVTTVKTGMKIFFSVEGENRRFQAEIYAIDSGLDVQTRTIMLRAYYDNSDLLLRPGMMGRIAFDTQQSNYSIYVPNEALVQSARGQSVWILKNGRATLIPVNIGLRTEEKIELRSGVSEGDTVVTSGLLQIREGLKVSIEYIQNGVAL